MLKPTLSSHRIRVTQFKNWQDQPLSFEDNLKPGSNIVLIPTTTAHAAKEFASESETFQASVVAQPDSEHELESWMHNA